MIPSVDATLARSCREVVKCMLTAHRDKTAAVHKRCTPTALSDQARDDISERCHTSETPKQ